jgi:hypothetical protein
MELIVVITLFPFLTSAFVAAFIVAFRFVDVTVLDSAFALPKPSSTSASPRAFMSMVPSALINRGATPPIKLIAEPSIIVVFAKLVEPSFYA